MPWVKGPPKKEGWHLLDRGDNIMMQRIIEIDKTFITIKHFSSSLSYFKKDIKRYFKLPITDKDRVMFMQ